MKSNSDKVTRISKRIEYSKIVVAVCGFLGIYLILFTSFIVIYTQDTSPLSYLIPSVFAAVSAALGFYFNKAKLENKLKILKSEGADTFKTLGLSKEETSFSENDNYN